MNRFGLAKAVASVLCLAVYLRVEVHIMQDDSVCSRQVQPLPSRSRRQQEGKHPIARVVEPSHTTAGWSPYAWTLHRVQDVFLLCCVYSGCTL